MQKKSNPPRRHHYIPAFYLKRWAGADGDLQDFRRPYQDKVVTQRCHPNATGYVNRLYELQDFPNDLANQVEENFFKPCDTSASEVLDELEKQDGPIKLNSLQRTALARFLFSIIARHPADIAVVRRKFFQRFRIAYKSVEDKYARARGEGYPEKFSDWFDLRPQHEKETALFKVYLGAIDNEITGQRLINMNWLVKDVKYSVYPLMTSDCPIFVNFSENGNKGVMGIPIGPYKYFFISEQEEKDTIIGRKSASQIVKWSNNVVVRRAIRHVFSLDKRQIKFIENYFGSMPEKRMFERIFGD
jgi:hypothetical protein